jgi:hypothetical protein
MAGKEVVEGEGWLPAALSIRRPCHIKGLEYHKTENTISSQILLFYTFQKLHLK